MQVCRLHHSPAAVPLEKESLIHWIEGRLSESQTKSPPPWYPLNRRLGESQKRSEHFILLVFVQQYLCHPARDVIMSPELLLVLIINSGDHVHMEIHVEKGWCSN